MPCIPTAWRTRSPSPASTRCSSPTRPTPAWCSSRSKPFDERSPQRRRDQRRDQPEDSPALQEGFTFSFMPPPILGLGNGNRLLSCSSRTARDLGYGALQDAVQAVPGRRRADPGHAVTRSAPTRPTCRSSMRKWTGSRPRPQGVPLTELFDTLQTYLGSTYVNDFNQFGRTWQVIAQADAPFRDSVEDIGKLRTRNDRWRDGADRRRWSTVSQTYRPGPGAALQRLSGRRPARRGRSARAVLGEAHGQGHRTRRQGAARRHGHRMDRPELPAGHPGQCRAGRVPAGGAAGLPGAGGAVRKLDAAAGGDPDRADDACCPPCSASG